MTTLIATQSASRLPAILDTIDWNLRASTTLVSRGMIATAQMCQADRYLDAALCLVESGNPIDVDGVDDLPATAKEIRVAAVVSYEMTRRRGTNLAPLSAVVLAKARRLESAARRTESLDAM